MIDALAHVFALLAIPPLLLGVIGKTKALFAGRNGPPLLQAYFDIWKLLHKGAVTSRTTTWMFRAGPMVSLAALLCAGLLVPVGAGAAPLGFDGDIIMFVALLGLGRFFTMAAALDTGSSFEGMGASREAAFSALAEPALMLALAIVCIPAASLSFADVFAALPWANWGASHPEVLIAAVVILVVLLAENSRLPVDDPATHLELTMIHEVMVLDHSGPDLAFITYGGAVKLWVFGAIVVHLVVPFPLASGPWGLPVVFGGELAVAVMVGLIESSMARLRMQRVPQFLIGASVVAAVGLIALFFSNQP
jgi:formate hydrogenlyase subunit 4